MTQQKRSSGSSSRRNNTCQTYVRDVLQGRRQRQSSATLIEDIVRELIKAFVRDSCQGRHERRSTGTFVTSVRLTVAVRKLHIITSLAVGMEFFIKGIPLLSKRTTVRKRPRAGSFEANYGSQQATALTDKFQITASLAIGMEFFVKEIPLLSKRTTVRKRQLDRSKRTTARKRPTALTDKFQITASLAIGMEFCIKGIPLPSKRTTIGKANSCIIRSRLRFAKGNTTALGADERSSL